MMTYFLCAFTDIVHCGDIIESFTLAVILLVYVRTLVYCTCVPNNVYICSKYLGLGMASSVYSVHRAFPRLMCIATP